MRDAILFFPVFLGLVGCAGTAEAPTDRGAADAFYTYATVADPAPESADLLELTGPLYQIETRLVEVGDRPSTLSAPRLTVYPRQRANVSVINEVAYVETFTVEHADGAFIADPQIGVVHDGVTLEVRIDPASADGAVRLAFHARVAELSRPIPQRQVAFHAFGSPGTIQLPKVESATASGARLVDTGILTRVARLGRPSGGEVDVLVRIDEILAHGEGVLARLDDVVNRHAPSDFESPLSDGVDLAALIAGTADDVRVEVRALRMRADLTPGEVLDEDAARAFGAFDAETLRELALVTSPVVGAEIAVELEEAYLADYDVQINREALSVPQVEILRSGLAVQFVEDGEIEVSWGTSPVWKQFSTQLETGLRVTIDIPEHRRHTRRTALVLGTRLLPLARLAGGGTLAVLVTVTPSPGQRRVASQTQASRKRQPSASTR